MIQTTPRRLTTTALRGLRRCAALTPLMLAAGCAAFPYMSATTTRPDAEAVARTRASGSDAPIIDGQIGGDRRPTEMLTLPGGAAAPQVTRQPATEAQIAALLPDEQVDAALAPQSIPQFVATAFAVIGAPYTMTPDVAQRTETIAGGTGGTVSKRVLFRMTQMALKQYGIDVFIDNGMVTVGEPASAAAPGAAQVVRGRAPTPASGRVVQVFNVQTIEVTAMQTLLTDLFPGAGQVRITPDPLTNTMIISGPGREVAQVVRVLRELDQPRFAGSNVLRVEPAFMAADALAQAVEQALTVEGFVVSRMAASGRSLVILSYPAANQILIFAKDPELAERANYWVSMLDRPASLGDKASTFVFQVRNTDAASLGRLAMGQSGGSSSPQPPVGVPGAPPVQAAEAARSAAARAGGGAGQAGGDGAFLGGRILTDTVGNRILFTGTASDYAQLRTLLTTLDVPAPQVVIEVMIAEVTLTDDTALGINLWGRQVRGDGVWTGGTEGVEIGAGGSTFTFTGPDIRAAINASASNNRVNILQRPQLVTRSGGTARFQVGTDVPIITSQRATNFSSGDEGTDVLQSVQYRQTGVIMEVTPVVYGDRVDIEISQEISSAGAPPAGTSIGSPTILNRSLTTQIAITNGWTGVLGGLISNDYTKNNSGVPFLKDVPIIGSAFQANTVSGVRTEILVLITPHIVRNDEDMADRADRYAADMNAAFRTGAGWSYTLSPWGAGPAIRGVGVDLPSAQRASERPPLIPRRTPRENEVEPQLVDPAAAPPTLPVEPETPAPTVVMATPPGRP